MSAIVVVEPHVRKEERMLASTSRAVLIVLSVLLFGCGGSLGTGTDEPASRKAKAKEMARVILSEETYTAVIEQATGVAMAVVAAGLEPKMGRELSHTEHGKLRDIVLRSIREVYPRDAWADAFAPLYAKHLTSADMDELLRFFKTVVGAKLVLAQGRLMTEGAKAGEELMKSRQQDFMARVQGELVKAFRE